MTRAKHDFIFVDESGDTGYSLDPDTGELKSNPHFLLAAFHVTDRSIALINRHIASFRYYTAFERELKFPPDKEAFRSLLEPINRLAETRRDICASVVYLNKEKYTGSYLKPGGQVQQSARYFRNRVLRCLLEHHFANCELESEQYDLILDRVDMDLEQIENQRQYLEANQNFRGPRYITHASSIYVEGLQVVDHIARGFKDVVSGAPVPSSLRFVSARDITTDRETWKNKMRTRSSPHLAGNPPDPRISDIIPLQYTADSSKSIGESPKMTTQAARRITYIQAVNEAIGQAMEVDPNVIVMGEDIAGGGDREDKQDAWGGPMRLTKGLVGRFGRERVRDTPISEAGFIGAGVGAAASGLRPVVDLMYVGFYGVCADQITNNAAKIHYMFGGKVTIPLTIMTGTGAGTNSAAQHSETLYSIFTHFPGLKCVAPSDPYTAKGLMTAAIRDDDPVIVFNNRQLMGVRFDVDVPEDPYELAIGGARIAREGEDVTLVGISYTTGVCLDAAAALEEEGYSVEVVDLLSLSPMDDETIIESVKKTRKIVIVDEDYPRCSIASDISALAAERAFDYLDAPPVRINAPHAPVPYSRPLEALFVPTAEMVVDAALSVME